jgi:hypothetical protein
MDAAAMGAKANQDHTIYLMALADELAYVDHASGGHVGGASIANPLYQRIKVIVMI